MHSALVTAVRRSSWKVRAWFARAAAWLSLGQRGVRHRRCRAQPPRPGAGTSAPQRCGAVERLPRAASWARPGVPWPNTRSCAPEQQPRIPDGLSAQPEASTRPRREPSTTAKTAAKPSAKSAESKASKPQQAKPQAKPAAKPAGKPAGKPAAKPQTKKKMKTPIDYSSDESSYYESSSDEEKARRSARQSKGQQASRSKQRR